MGYRLKRVCESQKGMITMGKGKGIRILHVEEGLLRGLRGERVCGS